MGLLRGWVSWVFIPVLALSAYLYFSEAPIDPIPDDLPAISYLRGALAKNWDLQGITKLADGALIGPEVLALSPKGDFYTGWSPSPPPLDPGGSRLKDGRVVVVSRNGTVETITRLRGRPQGIDFDKQGKLVVAEPTFGLLSVDPKTGASSVLCNATADGEQIRFAEDVAVARDGQIFFTDATHLRPLHMLDGPEPGIADSFVASRLACMEGRKTGRLLVYDPQRKAARTLVSNLTFANGVALAADESFVLVAETCARRISRYWLKGPRAGRTDLFMQDLVGYPDGISRAANGRFWVAVYGLSSVGESLRRYPSLIKQLSKLPKYLLPTPRRYGLIIEVEADPLTGTGNVLRSLHDPSGQHTGPVTSVIRSGSRLFLGSMENHFIGELALEDIVR
eukprot:tig00021123_g18497.t1